MHWIQTLRKQLNITQEELGQYLQLSLNTIKSVEVGRRSLPPESLLAAAALFDAIKNVQTGRVVAQSLSTPASEADQGRLVWAQRQIEDTRQHINDTSPSVQNLLAAEIVGLKNVARSLDLLQINSEHDTSLPNGPRPP